MLIRDEPIRVRRLRRGVRIEKKSMEAEGQVSGIGGFICREWSMVGNKETQTSITGGKTGHHSREGHWGLKRVYLGGWGT